MNKVVIDDSQDDVNALNAEQETSQGKAKTRSRLAVVMVIVGLLLVFMSVAYFIFLRDNDDTTDTPKTNAAQNQQAGSDAKQLEPLTVAYAHTTGEAPVFYWRSADGGDRQTASTLPNRNYVSHYDVWGESVAVVVEGDYETESPPAIWFSKDGGKSYSKTLDVAKGHQITSLKFSNDGTVLVFGDLDSFGGTNQVKEVNITNRQSKLLFTSEKSGVFIKAYNRATSQLGYFEGCYNCDGNTYTELLVRDIVKNETKVLYKSDAFIWAEFNREATEVVLVSGQVNPNPMDLGDRGLAPFKLRKIFLESGEQVQLTSSFDSAPVRVGYLSDTAEPYIVLDKKIQMLSGTSVSTLYETTATIFDAYYVSSKSVFVATASSVDEYGWSAETQLQRFDIEGQKTTTLLEADQNTRIFGVTAK